MAITDLRYAATLLKSGFSAAEVRNIIGLSASQLQQAENTPDPEHEQENTPDPEPEQEQEQENTPDPETEQEQENAPDPEPEPERQDPRTRRENPKTETLTETLAKLL